MRDPTPPQIRPIGSAVIALVSMNGARAGAPPPSRRPDRRHVIQDRREHEGIGNVGGGDGHGQRQPATLADQVELGPGLAPIDRICAHLVPRVWRARSWCPRWPATSPAGPAHPAGPTPQGAADRRPQRWPTRSGGASRSPASRSPARGRAAAATASRSGPYRRSQQSRPGRGWPGVGRHRAAGGTGSKDWTIAHRWSGTRSSTRIAMTEPFIPSRKERNGV
jgi:hypothetical protein